MKRLVPLSMLMLLTGCGGLQSNAPPTQLYILRAKPAQAANGGASTGTTLQLARLTTDPGLGSDRIVLMQSDHRMSFYNSSRWASELPDLIETLAVATLRATGSWDAVYEWPSSFGSDFLLQIAIRRFEADYTSGGSNPTIQVALDCTVIRRTGRDHVANFVVQGSAQASENRMATVVSAFEEATNQALGAMADKTAEIVKSAKVSAATP
jgi:cholesterol transport system auxiliary component